MLTDDQANELIASVAAHISNFAFEFVCGDAPPTEAEAALVGMACRLISDNITEVFVEKGDDVRH
jgi:hypothetical protein